MKKYMVTVSIVSQLEIEADSEDEACQLVEQKLNDGDSDTIVAVFENSPLGWEIVADADED